MRVAMLGAGYAGLTVARRLEDALHEAVELVVVDATPEHLVRHELHRVIRRPDFADDITVPVADVLDRAAFRQARVVDVDPDAGRATLDDGAIDYDYAAVCLGSATDFYGLPGVEAHATPLESLDDARRIRADFLDVLGDGGRAVVGGAGLTGIQVAGELAALGREEGADPDVVLLERLDGVAPGFPADFRAAVREELEARGVDVRVGTAVRSADGATVELDGGELPYDQFVWTGGIRGPAPLGGERPEVRGTLRLGDGTFVVGDAARVIDRDGEAVPASAQAAVREARVAAANIRRLVEHDRGGGAFEARLDQFDFEPRGWIVSVGDGAVAQVGPTVLRGSAALALKTTVGIGYLSSVGAVREAVALAREEFGGAGGDAT